MKKQLSLIAKFTLTLAIVLGTLFSVYSQNYSHKIEGLDYKKIVGAEELSFENNTPQEVRLNMIVIFDNLKKENIYISNQGWLSFEDKTRLKEFLDVGKVNSFISPLVIFKDYQATENYNVSYSNVIIEKEKCFVVQWENSKIAFQAYLYQNGKIEFRYNINIKNKELLKEKLNNSFFGVINSKTAIGYFPFYIEEKNVNDIEKDFLYKEGSFGLSIENYIESYTDTKENTKGSTPKGTEAFTSSTTWTCPVGVTEVTVQCWGAGGGGGSRSSNGKAGGAGGGAFAQSTVTVVPGNTYNIVVGTGGTPGVDGGSSSFGGTTVVADGGSGVATNATSGGNGGTTANSTGTVKYAGGNGANASNEGGSGGGGAGTTGVGGDGSGVTPGTGATLNGGKGGAGTSGKENGHPGENYGGGGGGSRGNGHVGGTGADGYVVLDYTASMSFVSSITTQASVASVNLGSTNQEIICIQVVTTGSTSPLSATSFTLNAGGSTDINDINAVNTANIYYTGTSNTFATTTLFGQNTPTIANYNITGTQTLAEGTNYFWLTYDIKAGATEGDYVDAQCTSLNVSGVKTPDVTNPAGNRQIPVPGAFDGTFESGSDFVSNGMTEVNDDTNYWIVGTATDNGGVNSAYITDDGSSNTYTNTVSQVSHFYFDYDFTAGATSIDLDFDWKCDGEGSFDNMRVFLVPTTTTPVAGTSLSSGQLNATNYSEQLTWASENITIDVANAGTTKRLVFSWKNDGSLGTSPPIAIDNITITETIPAACSGTPTAGTISSDITDFCGTATPTLTATGYSINTGLTFQWQSSPDNAVWTDITGATADTYVSPEITQTMYYRLHVTCTNSSITSTTNVVIVINTSETITSTNSPVNIACSNTANLTATASGGTIHWWDAATGGTSVGSGGSYTTPVITGNTTYYVSTGDGGTTGHVGKLTSLAGSSSFGSSGTGIVFDALSNMDIVSVQANVATAGSDVSIKLVNSGGTVLATADFPSCSSGFQTFTLNFSVPTGTDYRLVSNNTTDLVRDFSDTGWPYTLAGVCSLTGGWLSSASTTYYFFYDWVVSFGCESARTPVDIIVTSGVTAPDCSNLTGPTDGQTGISIGDVELTWDASVTDCQNATSYLLYLGTDNPPTNIENGTNIGNVTSYTPAGLTAPETYYWKIIPTNTAGDASGCDIYSFSTDIVYCESSFSDTDDEWISNVTFNTIDNTTVSEGAGSYGDYTSLSTTVFPGQTYPLSVTFDFGGSAYTEDVFAWFDWNHDGDFDDAGEEYQLADNISTPTTNTIDILVPLTANIGTTRMRITVYEYDDPTPCMSASYGETEDYTINISVPGSNTITVGSGAEPLTISSTIDTQGEAVLNFDFVVQDDGNMPTTDALQTLITEIKFVQGAGNTISDWSNAIAGAVLEASDGTSQSTNVIINATNIVFENVDFSAGGLGQIDDNGNKKYTLKIWLNCPITDVTGGDNFVFEVSNETILVDPSSSGFGIGENENSGATNNAIESIATHIEFINQPSDSYVDLAMVPYVKVAAVDDCGIIDVDFSGTVTLTSTGTMLGDPVTLNFVNGVASYNSVHTVEGTSLRMDAVCGSWKITSDQFNVTQKDCSITTNPPHTNGEIFACEGVTIDFAGTYTGPGTIDGWKWRMGDGNELSTQDVAAYQFTDAAGYYVELNVYYTEGMVEHSCATPVRVMVSGGPEITNVTPDITACEGGTYDLSASGTAGSSIQVSGYGGTGAVALSLAEPTFLPDTQTDFTSYTSVLEYTQFDPTSTLTAANLVTVYANIEHSYYGDLEIILHCPNGQSAYLADGYGESGNTSSFMGEPVDQEDEESVIGNGYEYRWTEVSPTYPEMSSAVLPTYTFTDNGVTPVTYTDKSYFPADTYAPFESFTNLIGCPLNGEWTLEIIDNLAIDNGYIFEWGLELDESLMPGRWDYETEIASYLWSGTGVDAGYTTGPDVTVTPPNLGSNIYTLTLTDDYGCSNTQDVDVVSIVCDGTWEGDISTDWNTAGNWDNNHVPDCLGGNSTIPTTPTGGVFPIISDAANSNDLTIEAGANIQIAPTGSLTVCGTLVNTPGTSGLIVKSDATGTGSLIHNTAGVNASIESYLTGLKYHYISSPISNATTAGINIQGGTYGIQFYDWDATIEWFGVDLNNDGAITPYDDDYTPWSPSSPYSGTLDIAKGYAYYYENQTLNYQGTVNVGDYTVTLHKSVTTTGDDADQGWNFIGNPYAASIDWDIASADLPVSETIEYAAYMFNDVDGTGSQANYNYYVPAISGITAGIGSIAASRFIPAGQGFFVRTTTDGLVLPINHDSRVHSTQSFYKTQQDDVMRFVIQNSTNEDEMILRLLDVASVDFDSKYDARKMRPTNPDIPLMYSIAPDNSELSINSLPQNNSEIIVPVGIIAQAGNVTIKSTQQTLEYGKKVYLIDNYEDKEIEMTSGVEYNFDFAGGVDNNRFELRFIINQAPIVNIPLENKSILEDTEFNFTIPEETFIDNDQGDIINIQARMFNQTAMPQWLQFNNITQTFTGIPENQNVGTYTIEVIATDSYGKTASEVFDIEVINVNDAPYLNIPIEDQFINANQYYEFSFNNNTFIDVDENDMILYNTNESGNTVLPIWITFENQTRTFIAEPTDQDVGQYSILVEAIDQLGAFDTDEFMITVLGTTNINNLDNNINISPNPTDGLFNINVKHNVKDRYIVQIYDTSGKKIMEITTSNKNCEIDLSGYAVGVYSLSIIINQEIYHKKIILK